MDKVSFHYLELKKAAKESGDRTLLQWLHLINAETAAAMDKVESEYKKYKNNTLSAPEKDYLDAIESLTKIK